MALLTYLLGRIFTWRWPASFRYCVFSLPSGSCQASTTRMSLSRYRPRACIQRPDFSSEDNQARCLITLLCILQKSADEDEEDESKGGQDQTGNLDAVGNAINLTSHTSMKGLADGSIELSWVITRQLKKMVAMHPYNRLQFSMTRV